MPDYKEIIRRRAVYAIPGMEASHVQYDVPFKVIVGQELRLDLYYPKEYQAGAQLPAIVFIHGDAPAEWIDEVKNSGQYVSWGQLSAASGFIGVTFSHRSSQNDLRNMYAVQKDIEDLIGYLRSHACALGIDPDAICLWAASSGVPYLTRFLCDPPAYLRCVVAYYGMMNLQPWGDEIARGLNQEESKKVLQDFSLVECLKSEVHRFPPMLLVKAELDHPDINDSIELFLRVAKKCGIPVDLIANPEGHHAFDILDDNGLSREIIRATLEFIKEHLKSGVAEMENLSA